jgi:hypothetical protein
MVTVSATLIPDAMWLVQIRARSTPIMMMTITDHITPFLNALSHLEIVSWLNAMSTKGMEMAADIETV